MRDKQDKVERERKRGRELIRLSERERRRGRERGRVVGEK